MATFAEAMEASRHPYRPRHVAAWAPCPSIGRQHCARPLGHAGVHAEVATFAGDPAPHTRLWVDPQ